MQGTSFRLLSAAATVLLLAVLASVVWLALRNQPATVLRDTLTATATITATMPPSSASPVQPSRLPSAIPEALSLVLDEKRQIEQGGFAFQPLAGYTLLLSGGSITMSANDATSAAGSIFLLSGGPPTQFVAGEVTDLEDAFDQFVNFFAAQDNFQVSNKGATTAAGIPGLAADLTGVEPARPFAGRIVMIQPYDDQLFIMVGVAPAMQWQQESAAQFEAVLRSVTFFPLTQSALVTPTTTSTVAPTPTPSAQPTPPSIPTPLPPATLDPEWQVYSNGNIVHAVAVFDNTVWAATGGGVMAWNKESANAVKFTVLDGLATNEVSAVVACPLPGLGIVFGSDEGLQIFDTPNGHWKVLNRNNSAMRFDDVVSLDCDVDNGYLLIAYRQHGLDIFEARVNQWTHLDQDNGLTFDTIRKVAVRGDREAIWVVSGLGISVIEGDKTFLYDTGAAVDTNRIHAITTDPDGVIWIGATDAVYKVNGNAWTMYNKDTIASPEFPSGPIIGMDFDAGGHLWLGSEQAEICQFDPAAGRCLVFFHNAPGMVAPPLTSVHAGSDGNIYYTTAGNGISMFDGQNWRQFFAPEEPLAANAVRALAQDASGVVWVATNVGVQQFIPGKQAGARPLAAEAPPNSRALLLDATGGLWLGGDGVSYYDGSHWTNYSVADGLASPVVQAMAVDNQNRVWIGAQAGLSIRTGNTFFNLTKQNGLPNDDIAALLADGDVIWIGSRGGGLYRFEQSQLQIFNTGNMGLPSDVITALAIHSDGSLLIGSDRGLARFNDSQITLISDVTPSVVTALAATPQGDIWVSMRNEGVFHFNGARWEQFSPGDKLPSRYVTALLIEQSGAVWIGCERGGLARYKP